MKRILYTLIGVMFSVGAWAQTSLQEQINSAADGATITLDADVNLTKQVEISGKNITIDLKGHSITYSGSGLSSGILLVHNGAGLTINATGGGSINSGIAMAAIALTKNGDDASSPAKLVVNGGTITGGNYGITGHGSRHNTEITINGGTITATVEKDNFGIYHPQNGKLTITGGEITAYSAAIEMRAGELNISGGTFTATATEYSCNPNGSGTTTVGAALAIAQHTTKKNIEVSITGGTFTGVKAINESNPQANDPAPQVTMSVTNGTFNGEVSTADVNNFISGGTFNSAVAEEYCAKDFIPTDDGNGNYGVKAGSYVAQVGDKKYETLAEAFEAITDNAATTIEVLADCSGNGIIVPSERDITVNFNNHTYTVNTDVLAGSNGTKNQCFQLLRDSKVTFNNGKIVADNAAIKMIIQNYSDLTLTGMTIDATQGTNSVNYVVSNNNGNTVFGTGTTITAKSTGVAFDVYSFKNEFNYTGANVTVDGATINGKIEVSAKDGADVDNLKLNLTSGTVNGEIVMGNRSGEAVVTKSEEVNVTAPEDYKWDTDGKLVPKDYVAQIGDVKYESLADAIAAAQSGDKVTLLDDISLSSGITVEVGKNLTLDLNGKTISGNKLTNNGTLVVMSSIEGGKMTRNANGSVITNNAGANLTIESGTFELQYNTKTAGAINNNGTLTINGGVFDAVNYCIRNGANSTIINGGTFTSELNSPVCIPGGKCDIISGTLNPAEGFTQVYLDKGGLKAPESYSNNANTTFTSGESYMYSLAGAMSKASNGETVTLIKDVALTSSYLFNRSNIALTLNLGGHSITSTETVLMVARGTLTIDGEGTLKGNVYGTSGKPAIWANGGNVIINNGTFDEGGVEGDGCETIFIDKAGTITINGGTFKNDATSNGKYWILNIDDAAADAYIVVKGGSFYNFDPANNVNDGNPENKGTNYVADGYVSKRTTTSPYDIYIVTEGQWVATIADEAIKKFRYTSLDEALDDAKVVDKDITVTLLTDAETTKETLPANVTINANEKVLTMPKFEVIDGEAFTLPKITGAETYKVHTATYIRTNISATEWGTVCLPFSLTSGKGPDYYTYNNINGSTLTVDKVENTETIAPNTPVVFKKAKIGDLKINEANATVSLVTPGTLENGALVGTYSSASIPADGNIYFINGDKFHQAQVAVKVPAYRAYIKYTAPSSAAPRMLSIIVGGENNETGVEAIAVDGADINAVYDMAGRKMQAPRKGMSIVKLANGKTVKLFVK